MKQFKVLLLTITAVFSASCLPAQNPLMKDFFGVNVKSHSPYEKMKRVGYARNFHLWADDQSSGGVLPNHANQSTTRQ